MSLLHKQSARWLFLLALAELVLLAGALVAATYLRFQQPEELDQYLRYLPTRALMFGVAMLLGLAALGQYQTYMRASWFGLLARQAIGFLLGGLGLMVIFYLLPQAYLGIAFGFGIPMAFAAVTGQVPAIAWLLLAANIFWALAYGGFFN